MKMAASNVSSDEILKKSVDVPESIVSFAKSSDAVKLEIDLSVKCRGCFAEDPEMHYLFTIFDQELSLADILMQTTTFECKEDDGCPPYLCTKCTTCLIDFFNFKIQLQKTDIYVRTLLERNVSLHGDVNVKTEQYDQSDASSTGHNSLPDESFENVVASTSKFIPDISKVSGAESKCCGTCSIEFDTPGECETHLAKEHGKNPFHKFFMFRKLIAENEKALVHERRRKRIIDAEMQEEILMRIPGKLCRFCRKKFPEEDFKAHWETHKTHVCNECGHKCIKKSDLEVHKQSVHNDARNFGCTLCDKTFKTKQLLRRHQIVHINPRAYCCDLCGQRFNDSGTLKTHVQLKHIRNRDFICPICGLAFPMKATLEKHILRHNKNRPPSFYCIICSSAFKDKSSLKRHHVIKHTDDYVRPSCEYCGKTYCSNTKLRYHIERHHSGKTIERKLRGSKKIKVEEFSTSSENSDSEDSGSAYNRRGPKVRNVSSDFYDPSPSYSVRQPPDDHSSYFVYKKEAYESEEVSDGSHSDSE